MSMMQHEATSAVKTVAPSQLYSSKARPLFIVCSPRRGLGGSRHRDDFTNNRSQNSGIDQPSQLSQLWPAGFNNEESRFYLRVISGFRTGRDGYYFPAF